MPLPQEGAPPQRHRRARGLTAEICLICLKEIEPQGSDPCRVKIVASDEHASWEWHSHEACIRAALHPDVQAEAGGELD